MHAFSKFNAFVQVYAYIILSVENVMQNTTTNKNKLI